jgi:transcriptional regulator with XRE-family HTH domain
MSKTIALRCKPKHHEEIAKAVGVWIKDARTRKGLTQKALANRIGCSQNQVFLVESGGTSVTLAVLVDMLIALDLKIVDVPVRAALASTAKLLARKGSS